MSHRHFKRLLVHSCTRQRVTPTQGSDGEITYDWSSPDELDLVCRYQPRRQRYASEPISSEVLTMIIMYFEWDADVTTEDRIVDIAESDGTVLQAGPLDVIDVTPKVGKVGHHLEVRLEIKT